MVISNIKILKIPLGKLISGNINMMDNASPGNAPASNAPVASASNAPASNAPVAPAGNGPSRNRFVGRSPFSYTPDVSKHPTQFKPMGIDNPIIISANGFSVLQDGSFEIFNPNKTKYINSNERLTRPHASLQPFASNLANAMDHHVERMSATSLPYNRGVFGSDTQVFLDEFTKDTRAFPN